MAHTPLRLRAAASLLAAAAVATLALTSVASSSGVASPESTRGSAVTANDTDWGSPAPVSPADERDTDWGSPAPTVVVAASLMDSDWG